MKRFTESLSLMSSIGASGMALGLEVTGLLTFAGFLIALVIIFFCIGMMLGNMNAVALQPLGHIAGLANSAICFISGIISLAIGWVIGVAFDLTVQPLMFGVLTTSILTLFIVTWADMQQGLPQALETIVCTNHVVRRTK